MSGPVRVGTFLLALALVVPASGAGTGLTWKGKKVDLAAPPAELPADARAAAESIAGWAEAHGYKLDLDRSGRALVASTSGGSKWVKSAEAVLALVDETFGVEPPPADTGSTEPWGASGRKPGTGTFVLVVVKSPKDHPGLLARLAEVTPYLAGWAKSAGPAPGFALEEPLAGAVVLGLPENKEWSAENEFVHRAAELALLRRFGRPPYWLQQGFAWHVELELRRGIYCFPYRTGFVRAVEHTGWRARLGERWRGKEVGSLAELATLRRGEFDETSALQAWGLATYLCEKHGKGLGTALGELHRLWDSGSRRDLGGGSWERVSDFEVPLAEQERVLGASTRAGWLEAARSWFVGG